MKTIKRHSKRTGRSNVWTKQAFRGHNINASQFSNRFKDPNKRLINRCHSNVRAFWRSGAILLGVVQHNKTFQVTTIESSLHSHAIDILINILLFIWSLPHQILVVSLIHVRCFVICLSLRCIRHRVEATVLLNGDCDYKPANNNNNKNAIASFRKAFEAVENVKQATHKQSRNQMDRRLRGQCNLYDARIQKIVWLISWLYLRYNKLCKKRARPQKLRTFWLQPKTEQILRLNRRRKVTIAAKCHWRLTLFWHSTEICSVFAPTPSRALLKFFKLGPCIYEITLHYGFVWIDVLCPGTTHSHLIYEENASG